jgi:hypothetical protein
VIRVLVAATIHFDLLPPPFCVGFRPGTVIRAAMPETSIHEYCNSRANERNIGSPASTGQSVFDPIAYAEPPERGA